MQMHSATKEQREAVRQLLHTVLTRDLGTFNPERFKEWVRDLDRRFLRVGYALRCHVHNRTVSFVITEKRSKRVAFKFVASTTVRFDDKDAIMSLDEAMATKA